MIRGVDHIAITVADLVTACRFYEQALGERSRNRTKSARSSWSDASLWAVRW